MKKHILITGTGRSGTTFLVQLLTELKFDTGFKNKKHNYNENAKAGMELLLKNESPYILKNPRFCDSLEQHIKDGFNIEHIIIPIRDLHDAAESRRKIQNNSTDIISGGLFDCTNPKEQEQILTNKFYNLMFIIAKYNLKHSLIHYPTLLHKPQYLYDKLSFLLKNIKYKEYEEIYYSVIDKELITKI
jgi:hypothetical protein